MNHDDVVGRELHSLVRSLDCRVIPLSDLAKIDARQRLGSEVERAGYTRYVVGEDHCAKDRGKVQNWQSVLGLVSFQLLVIHRAITGPEVDGPIRHLLDARAGTHGLVVELNLAIFLVVHIEPLGINRVWKCGAGPVNQERVLRPYHRTQSENSHYQHSNSLHEIYLPADSEFAQVRFRLTV